MIDHFKLLINETAHKVLKNYTIYHETEYKDARNRTLTTFVRYQKVL